MNDIEPIQLAFILNGNKYIPSHLSEIKKNHIYYLVVGGTSSKVLYRATEDSKLDRGIWVAVGIPIDTISL